MLDFVGFEAMTLIFYHTSLLPPKRDYLCFLIPFLVHSWVGCQLNFMGFFFLGSNQLF